MSLPERGSRLGAHHEHVIRSVRGAARIAVFRLPFDASPPLATSAPQVTNTDTLVATAAVQSKMSNCQANPDLLLRHELQRMCCVGGISSREGRSRLSIRALLRMSSRPEFGAPFAACTRRG